MQHGTRAGDGIWAITSYFNPAGYRTRAKNYRIFRQRLAVPLLTVELGFGPAFELDERDADRLVQVRGGDVLWQKERLLNLALAALPDGCEAVAWLDCDVVLSRPDWPRAARRRLEELPLVQLFHQRIQLEPDRLPEQAAPAAEVRHSVAYALSRGEVAAEVVGEPGCASRFGISLGLAWAAPRRLLEAHGFYDAGVLGGGDRALACAALGQLGGLRESWCANPRQSAHFEAWARPFHAAVGGRVGWIEGDAFHLWHGSREDRRYLERYQRLRAFDFDPGCDIAIDASGSWRWSSRKPELHRYVREYFRSRREDG